MAIRDSFMMFSDSQNINNAGGAAYSVVSTNVIDLGASGTDTWGSGDTIYPGYYNLKDLYLTVTQEQTTAAASATNSNLVVYLRGTDTEASATATGGTVIMQTGNITSATWKVAGTKIWQVAIPRTAYRYLFVTYYWSDTPAHGHYSAWLQQTPFEFGHMD